MVDQTAINHPDAVSTIEGRLIWPDGWPAMAGHGRPWPAMHGRPWPAMARHGQPWPALSTIGQIFRWLILLSTGPHQPSLRYSLKGMSWKPKRSKNCNIFQQMLEKSMLPVLSHFWPFRPSGTSRLDSHKQIESIGLVYLES